MAISITNWVLMLRPNHMNHMDSEDHLWAFCTPFHMPLMDDLDEILELHITGQREADDEFYECDKCGKDLIMYEEEIDDERKEEMQEFGDRQIMRTLRARIEGPEYFEEIHAERMFAQYGPDAELNVKVIQDLWADIYRCRLGNDCALEYFAPWMAPQYPTQARRHIKALELASALFGSEDEISDAQEAIDEINRYLDRAGV
jgi:hypothetical protein